VKNWEVQEWDVINKRTYAYIILAWNLWTNTTLDISTGIMTFCGLDNRGIVVRFPSRSNKLCVLLQSVKKGPGTHPSYAFDKKSSFFGSKRA
jgi:hypothetical protein